MCVCTNRYCTVYIQYYVKFAMHLYQQQKCILTIIGCPKCMWMPMFCCHLQKERQSFRRRVKPAAWLSIMVYYLVMWSIIDKPRLVCMSRTGSVFRNTTAAQYTPTQLKSNDDFSRRQFAHPLHMLNIIMRLSKMYVDPSRKAILYLSTVRSGKYQIYFPGMLRIISYFLWNMKKVLILLKI